MLSQEPKLNYDNDLEATIKKGISCSTTKTYSKKGIATFVQLDFHCSSPENS